MSKWCVFNEDFVFVSVITSGYGQSEQDIIYNKIVWAQLVLSPSMEPRRALYTYISNKKGEGMEVIIEANSDFYSRVRLMDKKNSKLGKYYYFEITI